MRGFWAWADTRGFPATATRQLPAPAFCRFPHVRGRLHGFEKVFFRRGQRPAARRFGEFYMRFLSPRVFCGTAAFAASLASVPASAQPVPPLQDLGTLGGTYSEAQAISADGAAVAGYAYLDGNS
ncbi:MAG: hypothetical protein CVT82_14460, partial [Alphaproteobacteria bacterium HGW-Alphaproteobacteria-4]